MLRFNVKCLLIFSILCYLTRPVLSDCRNAFIPDFDYFPDKVYFDGTGESSSDFSVSYHNNYIIVTNNVAVSTETYVLYCTAQQPALTNVPVSTNYIQIPVTNVAVSDRAIIPFLEILGEEESIKYVGDKSAITSPCLQQNNNLYDTLNFANTTQLASVDVIFTYTPITGGKYVQVSFGENTPALRKAEWIKFVSLFFNQTAAARDAFDKIKSNYLCHLDNVSNVPNEKRKTIAWVSLESDNTFTIKSTLFYPNITSDAAAYILIPQITDNIQSTDDLHQSIDDAYIVIDMSDLTAPHNTLDEWKYYFGYSNVTTLPRFLKEKRLFRTHKLLNSNGYDDWTESSGSRPDLILQDLIAIQYPLYQPDYTVRWFDKFAETGDNVIISGNQCDQSTFGVPKADFGTCESFKFNGENEGHKHNNNSSNDKNGGKERKVKTAIIIAASLTGSLILLGLGAWGLIVARRKYRERFVKLRDEPVVQMNSVKEVQLDSVKEVK